MHGTYGENNGEIFGTKYLMDVSGSHSVRIDLDLGSVFIIFGMMDRIIQSGSGDSISVCKITR